MPARKSNGSILSVRGVIRLALLALATHEQKCSALSTAAGVVRVDLKKELVQTQSSSGFEDDEAVLLSSTEMENDYAQLRNLQNLHIQRSYAALGSKESTLSLSEGLTSSENDDLDIEIQSSTGEDIESIEPPISVEDV